MDNDVKLRVERDLIDDNLRLMAVSLTMGSLNKAYYEASKMLEDFYKSNLDRIKAADQLREWLICNT